MFAVILTLCTYASCNTYFVDKADTMSDCQINLDSKSQDMSKVWMLNNNKRLARYLKQFNIVEDASAIHDYDYTCEFIKESDLP